MAVPVTPVAEQAVPLPHLCPMPRSGDSLPVASLKDTLGVLAAVVGPTVAKGPIIRRPAMVALAERLNLDRRAISRMQALRDRYGTGPLMLRVPGQPRAVILSPEHARLVLNQTPEPFATDSSEKRAALAHFEPRGVLISRGPERSERRRYNEEVLDSNSPLHRLAAKFVELVREELHDLLPTTNRSSLLSWQEFSTAWFRLVRRVILGNAARDDGELTDQLAELRRQANWAMLRPIDRDLLARFLHRLESHLSRAEPGSLAAVMAATPHGAVTAPVQQVPQWLFAFDSAAIATFRALALLGAHREYARQARVESMAVDPSAHPLPLLRAALLESVRLWPTTPMVLRETTSETQWGGKVMPEKTGILIYAPFFHRDGRLPFADRFAPELWLKEEKAEPWCLIPFSAGPASCPGRNLVLLLAGASLALLIRDTTVKFASRSLDAGRPLPATLNHIALRFKLDSQP
jgi:Cytochrome P450